MMCVTCGEKATKGSGKEPYCQKHFEERFRSYEEYYEKLNKRLKPVYKKVQELIET